MAIFKILAIFKIFWQYWNIFCIILVNLGWFHVHWWAGGPSSERLKHFARIANAIKMPSSKKIYWNIYRKGKGTVNTTISTTGMTVMWSYSIRNTLTWHLLPPRCELIRSQDCILFAGKGNRKWFPLLLLQNSTSEPLIANK